MDSLLYAMIEFFNHGIQGTATWSQMSLVPHVYGWGIMDVHVYGGGIMDVHVYGGGIMDVHVYGGGIMMVNDG